MKKAKRLKKDESKSKKILLTALEIIFISLMIISAFEIYKWYKDNKNNELLKEKISESVIVDVNTEDEDSDETYSRYRIDFETLKEINPDIVGWIKVNEVGIEYPVVKTNNNWFYLNHSFDKSYNNAGWIFADYCNKFDGTDKNIVIYGHNRRDGSMFGTMKNILKPEWYNKEENKYITFITEIENSTYEVFSIYQIQSEDYYIKTDFTEKTYQNFINTIKQRSIKDFGTEVTTEDSIMTLSTCANDNKYRVVLHAKKLVE